MEAPAPSRHARLSAGRLNLSRHIINPPALARLRQSRGLARVSTLMAMGGTVFPPAFLSKASGEDRMQIIRIDSNA